MHLLSWVCEFKSAPLPPATEDMLVTRFEKHIRVPPVCVHFKKYTPFQHNFEVFNGGQSDSLINVGSYKVYGDEYSQSVEV